MWSWQFRRTTDVSRAFLAVRQNEVEKVEQNRMVAKIAREEKRGDWDEQYHKRAEKRLQLIRRSEQGGCYPLDNAG